MILPFRRSDAGHLVAPDVQHLPRHVVMVGSHRGSCAHAQLREQRVRSCSNNKKTFSDCVMNIKISSVLRMFLGLLDRHPDPDPSINKQQNEENLDFYCFVTFFITFYL
jgi:hypothetical protein